MSEGQFQTTKRNVRTALPTDTTELTIRLMDWKRLYRKLNQVPQRTPLFLTISGVSFGVATSALLALIPLYQAAQSVDSWVRPTFWVVAVAAAVVGLICYRFAKARESDVAVACAEIQRDMQDIHETFFPAESLQDKVQR